MSDISDVMKEARRLSAGSELECLGLEKKLKDVGVDVRNTSIAERAIPALEVVRLSREQVIQELKASEAEWSGVVKSRGWVKYLKEDRYTETLPKLIGRLAVLRTRQEQLTSPMERLRASPNLPTPVKRLPVQRTCSEPESPDQISPMLDLVPGDLCEVAILSGKWAGQWVDASVHKVHNAGALFTVHILPTRRFDNAVGQANRIVDGVPSQFIKHKLTPRIKKGGRYLSIDNTRTWWPITVKTENLDGTYQVVVHDGTFEKMWYSVHISNIKQIPFPTAGCSATAGLADGWCSPSEETALRDHPHMEQLLPPRKMSSPSSSTTHASEQASEPGYGAQDPLEEFKEETVDEDSKPGLDPASTPKGVSIAPESPTSRAPTEASVSPASSEVPSRAPTEASVSPASPSSPSEVPVPPPPAADPMNETPQAGSPASKTNTAIALDTDVVNLDDL